MIKLLQFTKNNWKKLALACIPVSYGLNVLRTEYEISKYMRTVCGELTNLKSSSSSNNIRNVVVVLNPTANNKNSEKLFKKYCEPILHLAGYYVEVLKTTHVGHAKILIETLETLPDVIVIGGGDGTASEVVTGLFRRNDTPCPILLMPLGETSKTALTHLQDVPKTTLEIVQCLYSSLTPLIQNRIKNGNVFKYDLIAADENKSSKSIYGLRQFSWGLLDDIEANKNKYWYFGSLRHYAAALFAGLSTSINKSISANTVYTPPCPGCVNCTITLGAKSKMSFSKMYTSKSNSNEMYKKHTNENCKLENSENFSVSQIDIISNKNSELFDEMKVIEIKLSTLDSTIFKIINSIVHHNVEPYRTINCRTLKLYPSTHETDSFHIDGEEYDVRPIKITLLPNAIKMFS